MSPGRQIYIDLSASSQQLFTKHPIHSPYTEPAIATVVLVLFQLGSLLSTPQLARENR